MILFGVFRCCMINHDSRMVKFVQVNWIGKNSKIIQKAKVSVHKGSVNNFFKGCHLRIDVNSLDELDESTMMHLLKKN